MSSNFFSRFSTATNSAATGMAGLLVLLMACTLAGVNSFAGEQDGKASEQHWSFQSVQQPMVPENSNGHPVDRFLHKRMSGAKLTASPQADRRTQLRRLSFDLIGLPPTADDIDHFLADQSPDAWERVANRLLASPRFGERWARHWMDVSRYADNKGYVFFEDKNFPWAWTYREYVISAFNRDIPYDRFILEQLAADRLDRQDDRTLAALGFLTLGGHFMSNTHDIIDDRIDVVTRGLLGLSVSCARCHDHKFEPITTADYYSLYGIFRSCTEPLIPPLYGPTPDTDDYRKFAEELTSKERKLQDFVIGKHRELVTQARTRAVDYLLAAHASRTQPPADDFMLIADRGDLNPAMIARWRAFLETTRKRRDRTWATWHRYAELSDGEFLAQAKHLTQNEDDNPRVKALFLTPPDSMKDVATRYGQLLMEADKATRQSDDNILAIRAALYGPQAPADAPLELDWGFLSLFPDRATQGEYQKLIKEVETHAMKGPPRSMVLQDRETPFEPRVFVRGHPNRPGEMVPRQFLKLIAPNSKQGKQGSGRLELAQAIASKDNPLTARVHVNRVWMLLFGRGLVATPGDFGVRGELPTHPELLDWLASDLMQQGWSTKQLIFRIVTSDAYRQASQDRAEAMRIDPENRLLWKQNRRRLEFEALHDAALAVSGNLYPGIGGPSVPLFSGKNSRAVYGYIDRLEFPSLLATFDVPNPASASTERMRTTVAPQALYLMNGPFFRDAARRILQSSEVSIYQDREQKIEAIFRTILIRKPTAHEQELALQLLAKGVASERWLDLTHGLLLTNEFVFVD